MTKGNRKEVPFFDGRAIKTEEGGVKGRSLRKKELFFNFWRKKVPTAIELDRGGGKVSMEQKKKKNNNNRGVPNTLSLNLVYEPLCVFRVASEREWSEQHQL